MRRLPAWLLIVFVSAVALSTVTPAGRVAATLARRVGNEVLARVLASPALAQEVLEFKPVPPESASKLDEAKPAPRRRASTVPQVPAAPPPVPKAPGAPITLGKSGNIMRVGSDIHIESDQVVVGDVMAVGGDVTVDGHVEGDVVSMGGDVYVHASGRVDGDVVCMGGELHEDEGAIIGGQRVTATRRGKHARARRIVTGDDSHDGVGGPIVWLLITLGLAWAFAGLAPGRTGRSLAVLKREPGASAVTGMLAAMLTVPSIVALCLLVALLCITIIGIPLAIAALFGYFAFLGVLWAWGYVIGAAAVGELITRRTGRPVAMDVAPGQASGAAGAAWSGVGGAASAAMEPQPVAPGVASRPTREALYGVLVIGGAGLLGSLFHQTGLGAIGTLLVVLSWLAFSGLALIGAGAWLRAEFKAGTLSRLWGSRRKSPAAAPAAAAAPVAGSMGGFPAPPAEPPVP